MVRNNCALREVGRGGGGGGGGRQIKKLSAGLTSQK